VGNYYSYQPITKAPPAKKAGRKSQQTKTKKNSYLSLGFSVAGVSLLAMGVIISLYQWSQNTHATKQAKKLTYEANHNISHSVPSTNKPSQNDLNSYSVAPGAPRFIYIQKLNVKARIRPLGLTDKGQLEAPENVYDTGWFNKSSYPGQNGAMIIDGHISSWTTRGVFYGLPTLKLNDQIKIENGNGSNVIYKVKSIKIYDANVIDMSEILNPTNPAKPGLNLITCSGEVVKGTNEFNKRTVVFSQMD
jgi:sortase (surface protein transpeptidase)